MKMVGKSNYYLINVFVLLVFIKSSVQYANSDCGIVNVNKIDPDSGKIVGGYDVGYYKYPWFVGLHSRSGIFACGGTLITRRHILSAAHCFTPNYLVPENIYEYYLGVTNSCKLTEKSDQIKVYQAKSVEIHEKYRENGGIYDIALITLTTTVEGFRPICLPFKGFTNRFTPEGTVVGFGLTDPKKSSSLACQMQEARLLIYPEETCKKVLHDHELGDLERQDTLVCAGYLKGSIDSCQGDSGGPLQVMGPNNRMILHGITTFGWGCAEANTLGFYTNVAKFMDWITTKVGGRKSSSTNHGLYSNYYYYLQWYSNLMNQFL